MAQTPIEIKAGTQADTAPQRWWMALVNAPAWIAFLFHILRHWASISGEVRFGALATSFAFSLLWFYLIREKSSLSAFVASTLAFAASADLLIALHG